MGRLVHFEIHADDPARAAHFYGEAFGWKCQKWAGGDYWLVQTGDEGARGINGGLLRRPGPKPEDGAGVNAFPCTIDVESVDAAEARVVALGGEVVLPKAPVPGIGWLVYCKDTEGNIFGMLQSDPGAR